MPVSLTRFTNRKTALALILVSLTALGMVAVKPATASGDFWTSKAPMHTARNGLGVAVVDGKIYAIGGSTESGENALPSGFVGTNEEYDPATDTWTYKKPMPTPRSGPAVVAYQGKIYCIGGAIGHNSSGPLLSAVNEAYDTATDTWQTKKSVPTASAGATANVIGDRIFITGAGPNVNLNEAYDPATDSWNTKSPMLAATSFHSAVTIDKKIYFYVTDAYHPKVEIYDTETDSWSFGSSPSSTIYRGAAGATSGAFAPIRIYFMVGGVPIQVYDPMNGDWTSGAAMPTSRMDFAIAVVNDTLYAIGGRIYDYLPIDYPYPGSPGYYPYIVTESAANEQYTPLGYGTPDPSYQSPSPSPSASPTPSPEPQQLDQYPVTWIAAAVPAAVITIGLLIYFKKHRH